MTQCRNNLKQIGLALLDYYNNHDVLPSGYVSTWLLDMELGPGWGWGSMILPEMEQGPLFSSINFQIPIEGDANLTGRTVLLGTYFVPLIASCL